ncbi:hypothetical protein MHI48_20300 [Paenibacillus sp. FSL H7-0942]|uniref:hypothetical protein n=1 Tax=Paenibacillus TaxID=44249 RepID=UPI00096E165C|nr:hypothetical protein [Paenibacillus amylolyticus]OMF06289.1 hypothetical protein BK129_11440 [Paenibacillus amylolyticus]
MEAIGDTLHLDHGDFGEIERIKAQNPGTDYLYALNSRSLALTGINVKTIKHLKTNDEIKELHGKLFRILEDALQSQ